MNRRSTGPRSSRRTAAVPQHHPRRGDAGDERDPTCRGSAGGAAFAADAIGFDTESKADLQKGEVSTGPHLVQLATDAHVWLFPTLAGGGVSRRQRKSSNHRG